MHASVVVLILLVASTLADHWDWPINQNVNLQAPNVVSGDIHVNLIGIADFSIVHTSAIQICFQETLQLPLNASWWESACTLYFSFPGSASPVTNNGTVNLRDSHYYVGIYFANPQQDGHSENIHFTAGVANDSCPDNFLWNTMECQQPIPLPENYTFTEQEAVLFSIDVPELTGYIQFEALNTLAPLELAIRRSGAASTDPDFHDGVPGTGGNPAYFELPRPGRYILFARSSVNQSVDLNVSMRVCTPEEHGGGPTCKLEYNHNYNSIDSIIGVINQYYYWVIYSTPEQPLFVSVRANNVTGPLPAIIASKGNLPVIGNADIHNCNRENCGVVNSIYYVPSGNETWYVAVTPAVNGTDYGIWFDAACSPLCQANGICIEEGPETGLCVCNREGDIGVACQISDRVSQRFVVLAAIWGTALGVTVIVVVAHFLTSKTPTYERLA